MAYGFSSWLRSPAGGFARCGGGRDGNHAAAGKTVSESVAATLEGRVRLLVFDNCEHVLDAAADRGSHPRAVRTVKILATSREGLGVAREQIWPVRSLKVSAAVQLFVERAHSVAPGFSADDAVLRSVTALIAFRWPLSWRPRGWRR